jgi:hypothetical protein
MGVVMATASSLTGQSDPGAVGFTGGINKSNNDFPSERMGDSFNKTDGGTSHTLPRFQATQIRLINPRLHGQLHLRELSDLTLVADRSADLES